MSPRTNLVPLAIVALLACSEASSATGARQDDADGPAPRQLTEAELEAIARADAQRRERAKRLFGRVIDPLTQAAQAYEEHDSLEDSSWFGRDKEDNLERIDELLDQAIGVLGVSEIATTRATLRQLETEIAELEKQCLADREARLSAPSEADLSRLEKTYKTSREEIEARLAEAEEGIVERRARIDELQREFVVQMRAIGLDLDLDSARSLLSSVTGEDFVEMCVVFDNVRGVTVQLQELTEQSGESLDAAKRYYGSYVVLMKLMDKIQKDFVRRALENMIPRLEVYSAEAEELIAEARANMLRGGSREIGEQNIRSNELTRRATELYVDYLRLQAEEVRARNADLQVDLRDAENTYKTVALSSEVASLMREGSRNFAALLRLDVPTLRGFENAELEAEFERLTQRLNRVD